MPERGSCNRKTAQPATSEILCSHDAGKALVIAGWPARRRRDDSARPRSFAGLLYIVAALLFRFLWACVSAAFRRPIRRGQGDRTTQARTAPTPQCRHYGGE